MMDYTKEDYVVLEKALKDMKILIAYFERLIRKLEIENTLFDESRDEIVINLYDMVASQNCFTINNYEPNEYIDISWENLVFTIYFNKKSVCVSEQFEIWNDSECYCVGTLSIEQINNILDDRGNK